MRRQRKPWRIGMNAGPSRFTDEQIRAAIEAVMRKWPIRPEEMEWSRRLKRRSCIARQRGLLRNLQ